MKLHSRFLICQPVCAPLVFIRVIWFFWLGDRFGCVAIPAASLCLSFLEGAALSVAFLACGTASVPVSVSGFCTLSEQIERWGMSIAVM